MFSLLKTQGHDDSLWSVTSLLQGLRTVTINTLNKQVSGQEGKKERTEGGGRKETRILSVPPKLAVF